MYIKHIFPFIHVKLRISLVQLKSYTELTRRPMSVLPVPENLKDIVHGKLFSLYRSANKLLKLHNEITSNQLKADRKLSSKLWNGTPVSFLN